MPLFVLHAKQSSLDDQSDEGGIRSAKVGMHFLDKIPLAVKVCCFVGSGVVRDVPN